MKSRVRNMSGPVAAFVAGRHSVGFSKPARRSLWGVALAFAAIVVVARPTAVGAFEAEDYEEPAGLCFAIYANPSRGNWQFGFEDGTWLVNTPIMGQAFLAALRLNETDSWYGGIGMTLRLMPRWSIAPFLGAGGGYYHSWAARETDSGPPDSDRIEPESFWGGIVETGLRANLPDGQHFFDFVIRYMWNGADSRLNHGAAGVVYGQRW